MDNLSQKIAELRNKVNKSKTNKLTDAITSEVVDEFPFSEYFSATGNDTRNGQQAVFFDKIAMLGKMRNAGNIMQPYHRPHYLNKLMILLH